ncbi:MAG TPA: prephenate dehydratase, partial [Candidatus Caenarcaniphilales bacterium]
SIYSHPQALSQCQNWLEQFLPQAQLIPTNSTTEALQKLKTDLKLGAITSQRAAQLYKLPILACQIQDYPDNCTRFWIVGKNRLKTEFLQPIPQRAYTSLAFSVPSNTPGALVKPLQVFAGRQINLTRIESRPSKRALGDYVFFIDLEGNLDNSLIGDALATLASYTATLKVFGSYNVIEV